MYTSLNITLIDRDSVKDHFFCMICRFPLRTQEDFKQNKENNCCHECYLTYAESRKKEWKTGWRPDKETLEEYIYKRKSALVQQEIE
jgi:hypothetical protein